MDDYMESLIERLTRERDEARRVARVLAFNIDAREPDCEDPECPSAVCHAIRTALAYPKQDSKET